MSFKDFNRGLTASEVKAKKKAGINEECAQSEFDRSKESEWVLNILRVIKAGKGDLDVLEEQEWQKVMRSR